MKPGTVLAGKYRVEQVLGAGGMGVVVAAYHLQLGQRVAIKFLLPTALENQEAVSRFAREARAAVRIQSEHVARVLDVGTLPDGAPYMVMEHLEGRDLADWLRQDGALPVEQAIEFVLQACEAIAEAHAIGIVHRDLKPANLYVIRRPDGVRSVKVLDFGISKLTGMDASGAGMTQTAALIGSPLYMSPEQIQSAKDVDARTDIWALGVILSELLTGRCPFVAETIPALVFKIVSAPTPSIRALRADLPVELETAIQRCLQKDPTARYLDVAELGIALLPFAPARSRTSVERISGIVRESRSYASPKPGAQTSAEIDPPRFPSNLSRPSPNSPLPAVSAPPPVQNELAQAAGTGGSWAGAASARREARSVSVSSLVMVGLLLAGGIAAGVFWSRRTPTNAAAEPLQSATLTESAGAPPTAAIAPLPTAGAPAVSPALDAAPSAAQPALPDASPQTSARTPASSIVKPHIATTANAVRVAPHLAGEPSPAGSAAVNPWGGRL